MTTADDTQQPARRPGRPRQHGSDQERYAAANARRRSQASEDSEALMHVMHIMTTKQRDELRRHAPAAFDRAWARYQAAEAYHEVLVRQDEERRRGG